MSAYLLVLEAVPGNDDQAEIVLRQVANANLGTLLEFLSCGHFVLVIRQKRDGYVLEPKVKCGSNGYEGDACLLTWKEGARNGRFE